MAHNAMTELFGEPIHTYSRKQALEDGFQIDANIGDFAQVTAQHFRFPCYLDAALFAVIEKAVGNRRHCQDFRGIWHDICFLARQAMRASHQQAVVRFRCIIKGAAKKSLYTIQVECGANDIDDAKPCLMFTLEG